MDNQGANTYDEILEKYASKDRWLGTGDKIEVKHGNLNKIKEELRSEFSTKTERERFLEYIDTRLDGSGKYRELLRVSMIFVVTAYLGLSNSMDIGFGYKLFIVMGLAIMMAFVTGVNWNSGQSTTIKYRMIKQLMKELICEAEKIENANNKKGK